MGTDREGEPSPQGGGLNERALEPATEEPLSGTGGAAGGGTRAGAGEPAGEGTNRSRRPADSDEAFARDKSVIGAAVGTGVAEREAAEAAALGNADEAKPGIKPTIGEAIGGGSRGETGSGTPSDKSGLGGGGPAGQHGGTGPTGSASPGGEGRS